MPVVPCTLSGLTESLGLLLSNRESADRWPSQSGSLSVKHMQGKAVEVMHTEDLCQSFSQIVQPLLTQKEFLVALIVLPVHSGHKKIPKDILV